MLARVEAERELTTLNATAAAFGSMRKGDYQRYVGRLQRAARGDQAPARPTPELLAAMGISVVMAPAQQTGNADG